MVYGKGLALRPVLNEMVEHAISSPFTAKYLLKIHMGFSPRTYFKSRMTLTVIAGEWFSECTFQTITLDFHSRH